MKWHRRTGSPGELLSAPLPPRSVGVAWLGQAGFLLRWRGLRLVIDPYLSDSLAVKYRGTAYPHLRMMPPPIEAKELVDLRLVLCTHRHTDHMDPGTLPILAEKGPRCVFVVPRAERDSALKVGVPEARTLLLNAGESIQPLDGLSVAGVPAAHEDLRVNERGEHHFLGYVLKLGELAIYHSGDCVPFDGLADRVRPHRPRVALLPVNGRDEQRRGRGVPGNFTFAEAAALAADLGVSLLIPQHFGMFDFNTVDPSVLASQARALPASGPACALPDARSWLELEPY